MNNNLIDIKLSSNLCKKRLVNKIKSLYRRWKVEISDAELEKLYFPTCNEYIPLFENGANINYNSNNNMNNNIINSTNVSNMNVAYNQNQIEMINPLTEMNSNVMFNNLQSYSSDFLNDKTMDEFHANLINNNTDFFKTKTSDDMGINRCLMVQFPMKSYRFKVKQFSLKDFPL